MGHWESLRTMERKGGMDGSNGIAISATFNNKVISKNGQEKKMQAFWQWDGKTEASLVQEKKMEELHREIWIDTEMNDGYWSGAIPGKITWKDITNSRLKYLSHDFISCFFCCPMSLHNWRQPTQDLLAISP